MSRRKSAEKREILPDPVYNDVVVAKFVNKMMWQGKKATSQRHLYGALDELRTKVSGEEPLTVFKKALENCKPNLEVRSRRVGGATYQVPVEVKGDRGQALAIRWLIMYSRKRSGKSMIEKLAGEFTDACNNTGASVKKREDTHKMAEANRAFAHYRY